MTYKLTDRARADLFSIYVFSIEAFGELQAERYKRELDSCFALLAENPNIGRVFANPMQTNWRRHAHGRHIIFYEVGAGSPILILGIVHMRSLSKIKEFER